MANMQVTAKYALVGLIFFIFGAATGAGGAYIYSTKVLIPKYKEQLTSEIFSSQNAKWGDFFKKIEEEKSSVDYVNPFEGVGETSNTDYVNPFDLIE